MRPDAAPPTPVSATFYAATNTWACIFDRPLQPGPLDPGNWTFRVGNNGYTATAATAAGSQVTGPATLSFPPPPSGPDAISYAATPADVLSVPGLPAAPFAYFPMNVI